MSFFFELQFSLFSLSLLCCLFFASQDVFRKISSSQVIQFPKLKFLFSAVESAKPSNARQLSSSLEEEHFTPTINQGCSALFFYIYFLLFFFLIISYYFFITYILEGGFMAADSSITCKTQEHLDLVIPGTTLMELVTGQQSRSSGALQRFCTHTRESYSPEKWICEVETARRAPTGLIFCRLSVNTKEPEGPSGFLNPICIPVYLLCPQKMGRFVVWRVWIRTSFTFLWKKQY